MPVAVTHLWISVAFPATAAEAHTQKTNQGGSERNTIFRDAASKPL
jgi:hypothetical protein